MKLKRLNLWIILAAAICGVLAALLVIQSGTLMRSCYAIGPFSRSSSSVRDFRASSFGTGDLPGYQPVGQSGALGSSSFNIRRGGAAPAMPGPSSPRADRSVRYASPMTPMRISAGGSGGSARATFAPASSYHSTNQVQSLAISLAVDRMVLLKDPKQEIKTLVPRIQGKYRTEMAVGEQAFRQGKYKKAASHFETAAALSENAPGTLLALFHTHFATAGDSYSLPAKYLCLTLEAFSPLPRVHVRPRDFYGKDADFESDLARLETHVKQNPNDAEAQFVLGYIMWRERKPAEAKTHLSAALKNSKNEELTTGIKTLQRGMIDAIKTIQAEAPPMGKTMELPSAGVEIALPEGYELQPLSDINRVFIATTGSRKNEDLKVISLAICRADSKTTLDSFMVFITDALRKDENIRDLKVANEAEVSFLDGRGLLRRLEGEYRGKKTVSLRFCFVRELKLPNVPADSPPVRLFYMLSMAAGEKHADGMLPTLDAVAGSIKLVDFKRPVELPVDAKGQPVKDFNNGYAILQPDGWAGRYGEMGFEMGRMDYLLGGVVAPKAEVFTGLIPDTLDAKTFGEGAIKIKAEKAKGIEIKVLSQSPAKLAGEDGYQFVVRKSDVKTGSSHIEIARLICLPAEKGKKTLYAIILRCPDCEPERAKVIMDKIASGFSLLNTAVASGI